MPLRTASLTFAEQLGLSKSTGPLLLELSLRQRSGFAGHFPISGHCRIGGVVRL